MQETKLPSVKPSAVTSAVLRVCCQFDQWRSKRVAGVAPARGAGHLSYATAWLTCGHVSADEWRERSPRSRGVWLSPVRRSAAARCGPDRGMGRSCAVLPVLLVLLVLLVLCAVAAVLPGAASPRLSPGATRATPLKTKARKPPRATSKSPSGGGGGGKAGPASTSKPASSTASSQAQPAPGGGFSPASGLSAASRARHWTNNSTESPEEKKKETI
ncbi:uncharacterized protein LOC134530096 [Bacillus rossius redtenbacheri]|uniref:uncharacterized protein LOC134530096 n=1 Tax=Bacillus rossius redtenbacheri TaxID=93214 RepID=UPI002FDC9D08